ncbi:hypothetical protein XI04_03475 [Bradyrhizobium sp. CCBAU 11430]|nr:hypothetical protein [Bradyrhizobium sp. CCBAU 11430]
MFITFFLDRWKHQLQDRAMVIANFKCTGRCGLLPAHSQAISEIAVVAPSRAALIWVAPHLHRRA